MNRLTQITVIVLSVGLFATNVATAQLPAPGSAFGGGFGASFGPSGPVFLLANRQVQKELKLTEDQNAKVKEISAGAIPQVGGVGGANFREMTEEQRTAFIAELRKKSEEAAKKAEEAATKLPDVLTADQNTRLKQIQLWVQGASALTLNADLAKELALSDDQKEALKTIAAESAKKGLELRSGQRNRNPEEWAKIGEQLSAQRAEAETECMAVLTATQKAQFDKLRGPKFAFEMPQFGRGNRGARPGGAGN